MGILFEGGLESHKAGRQEVYLVSCLWHGDLFWTWINCPGEDCRQGKIVAEGAQQTGSDIGVVRHLTVQVKLKHVPLPTEELFIEFWVHRVTMEPLIRVEVPLRMTYYQTPPLQVRSPR